MQSSYLFIFPAADAQRVSSRGVKGETPFPETKGVNRSSPFPNTGPPPLALASEMFGKSPKVSDAASREE